jgi:hypothetical protein
MEYLTWIVTLSLLVYILLLSLDIYFDNKPSSYIVRLFNTFWCIIAHNKYIRKRIYRQPVEEFYCSKCKRYWYKE